MSSSSSGEIQSPFALLEFIEGEIEEVTKVGQEYRLGDRMVRRPSIAQLMSARTLLKSEVARRQGKYPMVSRGTFSNVMGTGSI